MALNTITMPRQLMAYLEVSTCVRAAQLALEEEPTSALRGLPGSRFGDWIAWLWRNDRQSVPRVLGLFIEEMRAIDPTVTLDWMLRRMKVTLGFVLSPAEQDELVTWCRDEIPSWVPGIDLTTPGQVDED